MSFFFLLKKKKSVVLYQQIQQWCECQETETKKQNKKQ